MLCPICQTEATTLRAGVVLGKLISQRCDACYNRETNKKKPATLAGKFQRDFDASNHRRERIQSWEPEFVSAYPDKAREYYSEEEVRKYS